MIKIDKYESLGSGYPVLVQALKRGDVISESVEQICDKIESAFRDFRTSHPASPAKGLCAKIKKWREERSCSKILKKTKKLKKSVKTLKPLHTGCSTVSKAHKLRASLTTLIDNEKVTTRCFSVSSEIDSKAVKDKLKEDVDLFEKNVKSTRSMLPSLGIKLSKDINKIADACAKKKDEEDAHGEDFISIPKVDRSFFNLSTLGNIVKMPFRIIKIIKMKKEYPSLN